MGINKVELKNSDGTTDTLIDLTSDTVTEDSLLEGYTAHSASGEKIIGTYKSTDTANTYYVIPEQYGAAGDGVTDDTEAFRQAIETELPIICQSGKNYYFANEIVTDKTRINIDGNYSHFTAFRLKINLNEDETNWKASYPHPDSVIQNIYFMNKNNQDYCIKTVNTATGIKVTIPKNGKYRFKFSCGRTNITGDWTTQLYKNGAAISGAVATWSSYEGYCIADVPCESGDEIEIYAISRGSNYRNIISQLVACIDWDIFSS